MRVVVAGDSCPKSVYTFRTAPTAAMLRTLPYRLLVNGYSESSSRCRYEVVANSVPNTQPNASKQLIVNDLPFKPRFGRLSPLLIRAEPVQRQVVSGQSVGGCGLIATKFESLPPFPRTFAQLISSTAA